MKSKWLSSYALSLYILVFLWFCQALITIGLHPDIPTVSQLGISLFEGFMSVVFRVILFPDA